MLFKSTVEPGKYDTSAGYAKVSVLRQALRNNVMDTCFIDI